MRRARAFARDFLDAGGIPPQSDIVLLVSELVTNAVLHGRGAVDLLLRVAAGMVRVEVSDAGSELPELQHPQAVDDHGRGLLLVDSISRSWGSRAIPNDGKQVWCEIEIS